MKRYEIMLMAGLCTAGALYCQAAKPAAEPTVRVEEVTMITNGEPKTYVGTIDAEDTVDLVARVAGTLEKAAFKEGSMVKKGDLLFEIEDTVYEAAVRSAKSVLSQMEAEYVYAKKEFERYKTLLESNAAAQTTYDNSLRSLKYYEAKLEEAKAALILAENDLSYTKIYSPLNGMIGRNIYSEGNYITTEKGTLATIVRYDPIKIRFSMSEADFFRYFESLGNLKASLEIFRADGKKFENPAKLDFIDNRVDSETGTLMIQLSAPNPKMTLIPGGYVTVKFSEKFEKPIPSINVAALMTDGKEHFVYVVNKDNVVEKRKIEAGSQVYDRQAVLSGLSAGERVIVGGLHKATPGARVKPISFAEVANK